MDKAFDMLPLKMPPRDAEMLRLRKQMHIRAVTVYGIPEHMIYAVGSNRDVVALDTRTGMIHGPFKVKP